MVRYEMMYRIVDTDLFVTSTPVFMTCSIHDTYLVGLQACDSSGRILVELFIDRAHGASVKVQIDIKDPNIKRVDDWVIEQLDTY
jgi:hypothetical protein